MRYIKVSIDDIHYTYKEYDESLYQSVMRIGFSFPIKLKIEEEKYYCVDGHKRLSILHDILQYDPSYKRGKEVTVLIENNGNVRSNDCWRGRNHH